MTPPAVTLLLEEGNEFWGRYPVEFKQGFRDDAVLGELHVQYLESRYFPVVGSVPKRFVGRNRRSLDISVARFESDAEKVIDRSEWGLPVPNREAGYLSLAKYAKDIPALAPPQVAALNIAATWMEKHFGPYMSCSRVKDIQEVIDGLDKTTSPGFPWTRKYATKRALLDTWKDFEVYMREDWERLRDPLYCAVFGNSLKEEIRAMPKILQNSIRTFTAGPIEMTIHGNRLFEDMNEKFYASHLKTASVVGFSPLKGGWNELYRKLKKFRNGFALDESQYDSSLRQFLMWACAQFRWNMLRVEDQTPETLERLLVYYRNLVNTLIITADGVFVMKQGGNPSGSVNTIVDNTLILFMLLAYAWIMVSPEEYRTFEAFESELALALCGDDNTWTVSDAALVFFNARSVIKEWDQIGVTTTTDSLEPRPVEQLDFLSAFTVFVDGIAVPLYNREKLLTSLLYSRCPDDPCYTLTRAAALLRVGWTDVALRGYLRELIQWLIAEYGDVLVGTQAWKEALAQIPTECSLRTLFLGENGSYVLRPQSFRERERLESGIKDFGLMEVIALPQRQRRNRRGIRAVAVRRANVGPLRQNGRFRSARGRRAKGKGRNKRARRRGNRGMGMGQEIFTQGPGSGVGGRIQNTQRLGAPTYPFHGDEEVANIAGTAGFASTQFPINPGQAGLFPWLSRQADLYERYKFTKLEFYYKTTTNQFVATSIGKVVYNVDFDAQDPPPASKQQAMDSEPAVSCAPYENMVLRVPTPDLGSATGWRYIRTAGLPSGGDIKTFDVGNLNVSTDTNGGTANIGELHVRYAGLFKDRVLESGTTTPRNLTAAQFRSTGSEALVSGTPSTLALATTDANGGASNGLLITNASGVITLPQGNYIVSAAAISTAATNMTVNTLDVRYNGATLLPCAQGSLAVAAAAVITNFTLHSTCFLTSDGNDTIEVRVQVTGTGAVAATGFLTILAV